MKLTQRSKSGRNLEAMNCLSHRVEAGLAQALGGLEVDEVLALDTLVFGIVLVSGLTPQVTIHVGDGGILYAWLRLPNVYVEHTGDFCKPSDRNAPVHETIARRADAYECARRG